MDGVGCVVSNDDHFTAAGDLSVPCVAIAVVGETEFGVWLGDQPWRPSGPLFEITDKGVDHFRWCLKVNRARYGEFGHAFDLERDGVGGEGESRMERATSF